MVGGLGVGCCGAGNGMRSVSRDSPVRYVHRTHGNCYAHLCGYRRTYRCAKRISTSGDASGGEIRRSHRGPGKGGRGAF